MITYVKANIFESPANVLVNTINTVGVMGKGIAKDFKTIYPDMFKLYQKLCEEKKFTIGKIWIYKSSNKWILNFPTKDTWRKPSKIEYIEKSLKTFVNSYSKIGITSIAFPPLGCGNGELNWDLQVRPLMEKYLNDLPINIFIYLHYYNQEIEHKNIKEMKDWLGSEPESLSFTEVWDDLVKLIKNNNIIKSIFSNYKFEVKVNNSDPNCYNNYIEFIKYAESAKLFYDDLCDFWNQLRNHGFSLKNYSPAGIELVEDYVFSLFSNLSYCKIVVASTDYNKINTNPIFALQFKPNVFPLQTLKNNSHVLTT